MQLSDRGGQLVSRPTPNPTISPGWANNDLTQTTPPTIGDPDWVNAITAELLAFLSAAGLSSSKTDVAQVLKSCAVLFGRGANKDRNSGTDIWARGTSGTISAGTTVYTADGWAISVAGANVTWAQVAGIGKSQFALRLTGAAGVTGVVIRKRIESYFAAELAGQICTVQMKLQNNAGASLTPNLTVRHLNSSDIGVSAPWTSPSATTDVNAAACAAVASTAIQVEAYSFTAAAASGNGLEIAYDLGNSLNGAGLNVVVSEFDISATPFVPSASVPGINASPKPVGLRGIVEDVLMCQRYLPALSALGTTSNTFIGPAADQSSTGVDFSWTFAVPARVAVTGAIISSPSHFCFSSSGVLITPSAISINGPGTLSASLQATITGGIAQSGRLWGTQSASASIVMTGAEL